MSPVPPSFRPAFICRGCPLSDAVTLGRGLLVINPAVILTARPVFAPQPALRRTPRGSPGNFLPYNMAERGGIGSLVLGASPQTACWRFALIPPHGAARLVGFADTPCYSYGSNMAERGGFEPPIPCGIRAFQARAFDHSATSPVCKRGATKPAASGPVNGNSPAGRWFRRRAGIVLAHPPYHARCSRAIFRQMPLARRQTGPVA